MANEKYLNLQRELFKTRLKHIRLDMDRFLIGRGNPNSPIFNIQNRKQAEISSARYAVYLCPYKNIFIVWDIDAHRKCGGSMSSFSVGRNWEDIVPNAMTFQPFYKHLGSAYSDYIEKVYVVGLSRTEEFFEHCDDYMRINDQDEEFDEQLSCTVRKRIKKDIEEYPLEKRKQYASTRKSRDARFRDTVLNAYRGMCAICRCDIPDLLEAAHEKSYEAAKTLYDDPKHGICLCANHHLMYDRGLIDIDLSSESIVINNNDVMKMPWYDDFCEKYQGKLLARMR